MVTTTAPPARLALLRSLAWRLLVALLTPALLWFGFLLFSVWQTERAIVHDLPPQAQAPLPQKRLGSKPSLVFREPQPGPRLARVDIPMDGALPDTTVVPADSGLKVWNGKTRFTVLLLTVDHKSTTTTQMQNIILASLDLERQTVTLVKLPHKLYVEVPGFGYQTLDDTLMIGERPEHTQAVGGGLGLMINTLRQNFGITQIDEYVLLRLDGLARGIDAVGGVEVNVPERFVDRDTPDVVFEPGLQHMDGSRVLRYAQAHRVAGDLTAMPRWPNVVLAVKQQLARLDILRRAPALLQAVGDGVQTSFSVEEQVRLARWSRSLPRANVTWRSIEGPAAITRDGKSVIYVDWATLDPVFGLQPGQR